MLRINLMNEQVHRLNAEGHNHVSQMTYAIAHALGIKLPNRGSDWLKETMFMSLERDYREEYTQPTGKKHFIECRQPQERNITQMRNVSDVYCMTHQGILSPSEI